MEMPCSTLLRLLGVIIHGYLTLYLKYIALTLVLVHDKGVCVPLRTYSHHCVAFIVFSQKELPSVQIADVSQLYDFKIVLF